VISGGLVPSVALDAERSPCPVFTEPMDRLGYGAPGALDQIVAIQHQSDGDALSAGEHSEPGFVRDDRANLRADLGFGEAHNRGPRDEKRR
jgi:hypothetical protein